MRTTRRIAIIGGGFGGVALATALLRREPSDLEVALFEASERLGRGLAYGTDCDAHVLNTRAAHMSVHDDDGEHFVSWCRARGVAAHGDEFVPRSIYGDYVEHSFEGARDGSLTRLEVHTQTPITDLRAERGAFTVAAADARTWRADTVVLATGHAAPPDPLAALLPAGTPRYLRNPWPARQLAQIGASDRVLVLGTGLTAVDVVLALERQGHRAAIQLVSRRGLLPQAHWPHRQILPRELRSALLTDLGRSDLRGMVRIVRKAAALAAERGSSWQAVLDALRPVTPRLWAELCAKDRQRFLRVLRPYWDAHRHRVAPAVAERLSSLRAGDRLEVCAGRVRGAAAYGDSFVVDVLPRGRRTHRSERFDWIVNCTGTDFSPPTCRPLERKLLERGMLLPDPLALGFVTADRGAVIGRSGPVAGLYVLGTGHRPNLWEHTAVPEIRSQVMGLADELVASAEAPTWLPRLQSIPARRGAPWRASAGPA
jgi:uncharacterized NAD(P)/FAD-binding protein YdhS